MPLPTTLTDCRLSNAQRNGGPFKSSAGAFYAIVEISTGGTLKAMKVTDPEGGTWAEQDSGNHPVPGTSNLPIDVKQDGDNLHVATQTSAGVVHYHVFSMASDTWTTVSEVVVSPGGTISGLLSVAIAIRSGNPVIMYATTVENVGGTDRARIALAYKSGTWTTGVSVDGAGVANDFYGSRAVTGASDRVHFFYRSDVPKHRSLSSGNVLDTAVTPSGNANQGWGQPTSFDEGGTIKVRIPRHISATTRIAVSRFDSGATPTIVDDVLTAAHTLKNFGQSVLCGLGVVRRSGSIDYLLYIDSGDLDLYRSDSSDAYASSTAVEAAITAEGLSGNVYVRGSNNVFAYLIQKSGVLTYNEYVIGSALSIQYVRPDADISGAGWKRSSDGSETDVYTMVDEPTPDDADYMYTDLGDVTERVKVLSLGVWPEGTPPVADGSTNFAIRARHGKHDGSSGYMSSGQGYEFKVELLPPPGDDTVLATYGPVSLGTLVTGTFAIPNGVQLVDNMRYRLTRTAV